MEVQTSFQYPVFLLLLFGNIPEVRLLDRMVILFLIFWRNSILFSVIAESINISTNGAQGRRFLQTLANHCYLLAENVGNKFTGISFGNDFLI